MDRAVFLDRDGVINAMVLGAHGAIDSPQRPEEFHLLPGVAGAIASLNRIGLPVVVVSNQPGTAKGKSTLDLLDATHALLRSRLRAAGAHVDGIYCCLHHPDAVVDDYRVVCDCRKPRAGLLRQAAADLGLQLEGSYMVGDQPTDVRAGREVGCVTFLIEPRTAGRFDSAEADHMCADLVEAARLIAGLEEAFRLTGQGVVNGDLC